MNQIKFGDEFIDFKDYNKYNVFKIIGVYEYPDELKVRVKELRVYELDGVIFVEHNSWIEDNFTTAEAFWSAKPITEGTYDKLSSVCGEYEYSMEILNKHFKNCICKVFNDLKQELNK